MRPNEIAILAIFNEKHTYELEELKRAAKMIEANVITCTALCRQGFLERNRLGQLQVSRAGNDALIKEFSVSTKQEL